jgi:hypothetical protein
MSSSEILFRWAKAIKLVPNDLINDDFCSSDYAKSNDGMINRQY